MTTRSMPSDEELKELVCEAVEGVDVERLSVKQFISKLSHDLAVDLKPKKAFIKSVLAEAITRMHNDDRNNTHKNRHDEENEDEEDEEEQGQEDDGSGEGGGGGSEEEEEEEEEEDGAPVAAAKKKKKGGGLGVEKEISTKLANFLKKGNTMARTQIVKCLWEYIHKHNLQNPMNRKEIFLDQAMQRVFGVETFTMFSMNKYIGEHIHPFKKADFSSSTRTPNKKRRASSANGSSKKKKQQRRGPTNQAVWRLSDDLANVVGVPALSRPQVVSKIWDYIKLHQLQNPSDRREILCDDKLRAVMKKSKVTMFNMNQCITVHLLEKVDTTTNTTTQPEVEVDDDDESE